MKILSAKQLYQAHEQTMASQQISEVDLLERAGHQVFQWIHRRMQGAQVKIHIFNGIGNNGGVGLVLARYLFEHGYNVSNYVVNYSKKRTNGFLKNYDRVKDLKEWPKLLNKADEFPTDIHQDDIIVDAIFGIGLNRDTGDLVNTLFQYLNQLPTFKLAIDIPSGLFANKAPEDFGHVLKVNYTLSFQSPKLCFFLPETAVFTEQWEVLDIGLDPHFLQGLQSAHTISKLEAAPLYQSRPTVSSKFTYGHVLAIGGSYGKIGAMQLTSRAALKSGCGLITTYLPKCGYHSMQAAFPEAMVLTDTEEKMISSISLEGQFNVAVIGNGMGTHENTQQAFNDFIIKNELPLVIDADGINLLALNKDLLSQLPDQSILTPHKKELERLIGAWTNDFEMLEMVKAFSNDYNCIMVVKGAHTITVYKEEVFVNLTGNQALATAGTGDVLAGIIAGLRSQNYPSLHAAVFGVYLHGRTADIGIQELGYHSFIASDAIEYLSKAYLDLFKKPETPKQE